MYSPITPIVMSSIPARMNIDTTNVVKPGIPTPKRDFLDHVEQGHRKGEERDRDSEQARIFAAACD